MSLLSGMRAIAVDVDGTVANAEHVVSRRTLTALAYAQQCGYLVLLVTGRSRSSALAIARDAGLHSPVISCNGAVTTRPDDGADVRVVTLAPEEVMTMARLAAEQQVRLTWWTVREIFIDAPGLGRDLVQRLNGQEARVADPAHIDPGAIVKAMFYGTGPELDSVAPVLQAQLPRLTRSMEEFLELGPREGSKWETLHRVLTEHGISPAECLGIGDGGNDVPWLSRIGFPVAMGNARQEVKDIAQLTIGDHGDDGVAAFLEEQVTVRG